MGKGNTTSTALGGAGMSTTSNSAPSAGGKSTPRYVSVLDHWMQESAATQPIEEEVAMTNSMSNVSLDQSLTSLHWLQHINMVDKAGKDIANATHKDGVNVDPNRTSSSSMNAPKPHRPRSSSLLSSADKCPTQVVDMPAKDLDTDAEVSAEWRWDEKVQPPHTAATLIAMALSSEPSKRLPLSGIFDWIENSFPYYKVTLSAWQPGIRQNLSVNKVFCTVPQSESEGVLGSLWTINPAYPDLFKNGVFKKSKKPITKRKNSKKLSRDNSIASEAGSSPPHSATINNDLELTFSPSKGTVKRTKVKPSLSRSKIEEMALAAESAADATSSALVGLGAMGPMDPIQSPGLDDAGVEGADGDFNWQSVLSASMNAAISAVTGTAMAKGGDDALLFPKMESKLDTSQGLSQWKEALGLDTLLEGSDGGVENISAMIGHEDFSLGAPIPADWNGE